MSRYASLYQDKEWQMYNFKTGKVTIISGARGCKVAGDPRPIPGFNNFCLECPLEEIGGGIKKTVLIPTTPVPTAKPTEIRGRDNIGVALNGVLLGPPAPLEMILSSHSLGVFDDCGAHANPHEGYHYHAATGCTDSTAKTDDGHAALIGYASDGYGVYAMKNAEGKEIEALDECRGTSDGIRGYHYHAASPSENMFIGCLHGESVPPAGGPPGRGGRPDGPPPGHDTPPNK